MIPPLRLTFFSTVHPHPWNPTKGVFNSAMLRALVDQGVAVQAIVPVPWTERRGNAQPIDPGYPVTFVPFWFIPRLAPMALAAQLGWSARAALSRAAGNVDVLLGYWADPDGTVLARIASARQVPFVQMVGGSDVMLLAGDSSRGRRILSTLSAATQIITIGEGLRLRLIEMGLSAAKIQTYRRGVDRERFSPGDKLAARRTLGLPADRKILLWVGRMVPVKGLHFLLEAMGRPELASAPLLLAMVGDGPIRPELEKAARERLPPGAVRFAGSVPHEELPTWYRAADLVVLPSLSEGVPNVLLEALACGTGFVASDVGSVRELVSDSGGELVPPGDPAALATSLASQLNAPSGKWREVPDSADSAQSLLRILQRSRS